jgi:CubicO group peptidase (beta-lactamase class C family)
MASVSPLKRSNPEAEGIPSKAVLEFVRALEQHVHPLSAVEGFMLLRHGHVAAEGWWRPYGPECPHPLQSLSKSFTSSAVGLAIQEGLLTVDDPVLKFFSEDAPAQRSENLKAMRVRHLLSMNTGLKLDTTEHVFQHLYQINVFCPMLHQRLLTFLTPVSLDDNWPRVFL